MGDLTCSHDKGEHRMKICEFGRNGKARLLFVAHARAVGDGERALFRRQFGGEVGAGDPGAVDAAPPG